MPDPAPNRPYIGGQAVLEGVMMRAPSSFAIAVRRKDGSIVIRERAMEKKPSLAARLPLVRGIHSLVESLKLGSESLKFSVSQLEADMAAEEAAEHAKKASVLNALTMFLLALGEEHPTSAAPEEKKSGPAGFMAIVAVVFLIALPQVAAGLVNKAFHLGLDLTSPAFQAITGAMKLSVVIGYMLLIRRVPEIRRVFQFHGAEHKTISTYEANEELTVENARRKTTLHPRCGTTFLVMVAIVSVCVFTVLGAFMGKFLPKLETGHVVLDHLILFVAKLPFLPFIAAITFEIQRVFAKYFTKGPLRLVLVPGFLVQKITTIEPDDDQLEIALASLRATLFREEGKVERQPEGAPVDVTFPSYAAVARAEQLRAAA